MRTQYLAASLLACVWFSSAMAQQGSVEHTEKASALRLEADVRFLSHDMLEGREAGTRGYDLAALYVAEAYRGIGLDPGGDDDSYFQQVPLREVKRDPNGIAKLTLSKDGKTIDLTANEDFYVFSSPQDTQAIVEAPAVFAGYALVSDEHDRDDFEGLDVEGKVVFTLTGAPKFLNSEERAYHSAMKGRNASDRGAIGVVGIYTDTFASVFPFTRLVEYYSTISGMRWLDVEGQPFTLSPNVRGVGVMSRNGAEQVFSNSEHDWPEILAAAESEAGEVTGFDLGINARIEVDSLHRQSESPNVVGILPGSDPVMRDEYVILSAHLDHDGMQPNEDPNDDEIFNGAMDNAVGVAAMLEVSRLLSINPPKRSVVFVALAAEEKGLLGSDFFARNPTVPSESMVAVVNLDMPIMTYDFTDVVAFGAERSTLFPVVEAALEQHGLILSPDPLPDEGLFTRSDHYSFVKQGIPAVYLSPGFAAGGEQAQAEFRQAHYHKVSDEVEHVDFDVLAKFSDTKYSIALGIANMATRPVWKRGDFFGRTFEGPMED
ncbi:MAG: M28 family metallopeptidase [Woeseiaceae bacterium]